MSYVLDKQTGNKMGLQEILDKIDAIDTDKVSNKEIAFFGEGNKWGMYLGKPYITTVTSKKISGDLVTEGKTILECAEKMLIQLLQGGKEK